MTSYVKPIILFVDDDEYIIENAQILLDGGDKYELVCMSSLTDARNFILSKRGKIDLRMVIADMDWKDDSGDSGNSLLKVVKACFENAKRVILSGQGDNMFAIAGVNSGAVELYIEKNPDWVRRAKALIDQELERGLAIQSKSLSYQTLVQSRMKFVEKLGMTIDTLIVKELNELNFEGMSLSALERWERFSLEEKYLAQFKRFYLKRGPGVVSTEASFFYSVSTDEKSWKTIFDLGARKG